MRFQSSIKKVVTERILCSLNWLYLMLLAFHDAEYSAIIGPTPHLRVIYDSQCAEHILRWKREQGISSSCRMHCDLWVIWGHVLFRAIWSNIMLSVSVRVFLFKSVD